MDISNLPNDVMKHIESFVDKRPPFADELLNREFTEYFIFDDGSVRISNRCGYSSIVLKYIHPDGYWINEQYHDGWTYTSTNRIKYDGMCCKVFTLGTRTTPERLGRMSIQETFFGICNFRFKFRLTTLGLLMQEDADKQGIPPQTFNCGQ